MAQTYDFKLLFAWIFVVGFSCNQNQRANVPNVSSIDPQTSWYRSEEQFFLGKEDSLSSYLNDWQKTQPEFYKLYFGNILGFDRRVDPKDSSFTGELRRLRHDSLTKKVLSLIQQQYGNIEDIKEQIDQGARFMRHYFPGSLPIHFYTMYNEFSVGNFIFAPDQKTEGIGIGLDFFLGNAIHYKDLDPRNSAFSEYITRSFNRDHVAKKTWEIWVEDKLGTETGAKFIDNMIQQGKKLYILSRILPQAQDSVLFEFSASQMRWCQENEANIWSYFLNEKLMYETDRMKFIKYVDYSPNSPGMPKEAPGRTGCFIGYQIVSSYMDRHPGISLPDLIAETSPQKILEESKYRPRNSK